MTQRPEGPRRGLRLAREARNWTQKDVAVRLQDLAFYSHEDKSAAATPDMVAKWERGVKGISAYYRRLLCELFECDAVTLDIAPSMADVHDAPWSEQLRYWREEVMDWSREEFCEHHTYHAFQLGEVRADGERPEIEQKDVWRWETGATQTVQNRNRRIFKEMGAPLPPRKTEKRTRPPDYLPADVLARPDFREACTRRDVGEVLKLAKQYGGPGFTASHLARRCEMTPSRVAEYMNGKREATTIEVFARITDSLHIPGEFFDLAPRAWEGGSLGPSRNQDGKTPDESSSIGEDVNRKQFFKSVAALSIGPFLPRPGLPVLNAPSRIGSSDLDRLEAVLSHLLINDQNLGAGPLVRMAIETYSTARTILDQADFSDTHERRLVAVTAALARQAGWLSYDHGDTQSAQSYYSDSLFLGQQMHDSDIMVQAMANMSHLSLHMAENTGYRGHARDSARLGEGALALVKHHDSPHLHALLSSRVARARAYKGDAIEAKRYIGKAWRELERAYDIPAPDWLEFVTESEIAFHDAMVRADLGEPGTAIDLLQSSAAEAGFARNSLYSQAQLALTFARHGDLASAEQEAASTVSGLQAHGVTSKRIHNVLLDVRQMTKGRRTNVEWWHLLER